jgi:putative FmdB family regulatory protein
MPLYEYSCDGCGERFELIRRLNDEEPVVCPQCNEPASKLLSGFAVQGAGESGGYGACGSDGGGWSGG